MTATARLLFFAGSARAGSHNKKLARLGAMIAEANGIPATFLDLLPMAIGLGRGSEALTPLARTVVGGLVSATALTLFVVPVLFTLLVRDKHRQPGRHDHHPAHPHDGHDGTAHPGDGHPAH